MRLLSRLLIVSALCLASIALPTAPAQAICVPYSIQLTPKYGLPGTAVTISGYDFAKDRLVDIYYNGRLIASLYTDKKGNFITTITIPEGCQGQYEVLADLGYTKVHTYFTVKPGLTITPEKGPVGTTVTVMGQGFAKNEDDIKLMYYLTSDTYETIERRIKANSQGSWQTSFQVPSSTRGEHKVDAEGAVSRHYNVKDAIFRVTAEISIDKSSGIPGDTVTMAGSRFGAYEKGLKILFGDQAVATGIKANSKGEWQASFKVPNMPGGNYSVTAEGDQTKREDIVPRSFEIKEEILLSPTEGHVGIDLTVSGRGFAANQEAVITYDGNEVATVETDDKGSFEITFAVPQSKYGEHQVTASYAGENHAIAIFTVESQPPPIPTLVSPVKGSRLGFIDKVAPTFEWSEVFDDSGVLYSLQIATSADFANSIISKDGLSGTSYTVAEANALPIGTYYWRVKAVDGAENTGGWTTAYSFRVGLLPRWGFLAAIAAAVVLFILLIRALVRRRSLYYDGW